jgi:hypothetical protein
MSDLRVKAMKGQKALSIDREIACHFWGKFLTAMLAGAVLQSTLLDL